LPIQYADYASWQGDWLQGETLERLLDYWKTHLKGSVPVLDLPTDKARPKVQSFNGARRSMVLPNALVKSLTALSHRHQATLFMSLLAAFYALLHRHTGQEDIIVGTPVAGRARPETQNVIGLFLNTVALRTDVSGNPTFEELLTRVRRVAVDALTYQDLPFEKLVMELQPERSLNRTPLFQVVLNMFMMAEPERYVSGVQIENLTKHEAESKYDLTLYVQAAKQDLRLDLVFNTDLFHAARMEEMLEQFKYLLEQIAAAPDRPIRSYSLVTRAFRRFLPDPTVALPEPYFTPVASDFLAWANQAPAQHAVVQGDRAWSYDELSRSAHALARTLVVCGLQRAAVAAVIGPRSFGLIASTLGVFMSGGVLLLVDRHLPANRQRLMLSEARATHLLYIGEWRQEDHWLREMEGLRIIRVATQDGDTLAGDTLVSFEERPLPQISPDDAAYIFFTSGTTGVPRGVLGCHKGLSHFLTWQKRTFNIGPGDRCAQLTNLSFDVVLRDIFLPLVSGATLCLPDENLDPASDGVLSWMDRQGITVFHAVPTLAQSWLSMPHGGVSLRTLRWAFFSGEALSEAFVRRWRNAFPRAGEIVNLYGPTETTLVKCFHVVPAEPSHGVQPIGRPLPHCEALVLTENAQLCGVGESGEIVLRTPFRTLGYINAPEEQRKRFGKNPFRDDPQDRIYHTGDQGRYCADGTLEILGRLDDQVKVRGVRVEPGEIIAILGQHPRVAACFVAARKDQQGDNVLAAYVVPASTNAVTVGDLRSYLATRLPAVMVPSGFVFLEALPLTPNGKINRRALPEPDLARPELGSTFVPPRTPIESILAGIVGDVLGLTRVGCEDDFFELGGHSLLATRVISRISTAFRVDLPLRTLFETPTVAGLAAAIAARLAQRLEHAARERLLEDTRE
jgi:amino acid adenylation domain-containing protein